MLYCCLDFGLFQVFKKKFISAAEIFFTLDFLQGILHCQMAISLQAVEVVLMKQSSMVLHRSRRFLALGTVTCHQFVTTVSYVLLSKSSFSSQSVAANCHLYTLQTFSSLASDVGSSRPFLPGPSTAAIVSS